MTCNRRGKTVGIVQARVGSSRLPGKVLSELTAGVTVIDLALQRASRASRLDELWLACPDGAEDDALAARALAAGVRVFRGDAVDVLGRVAAAARQAEADVVVRLTADCPFMDPAVIDTVVDTFHQGEADFVSNTLTRSWPDGLDVEVFTRAALERTEAEATLAALREHVTPYMHGRHPHLPNGGFTIAQAVNDVDFSHLRWVLDESDDLELFRRLLPELPAAFRWTDVVAVLTRRPTLLHVNSNHQRHEGSAPRPERCFDASNAFFERAERLIPLATQTFSKSHQQWVKGAAPLFLQSGRGCRVTDLDGNSYIDYVLGLLPIVLGYRDPDVDAAIQEQLDNGITFSLPHPLETEVAERLVRLIPCAEMVRFGKNGSDATTAAIRLARAFTGRDKVAMAGYHGWHDWYIGTTTRKLGVPKAVQDLSATFPFDDPDALDALLRGGEFAAVIIEPTGAHPPAPGVLERIREVTAKHGTVLIFDETITGFRVGLNGAQGALGVTPDLATFGKAMANGMPVSAIVGRADIMGLMKEIFFSATFGGETLSLAAARATIDKLEREAVLPRLCATGEDLMRQLNAVCEKRGFGGCVSFIGEGWWPRLDVAAPPVEPLLLKSLLRQYFNANGLLLAGSLNLSLAHTQPGVVRDTVAAVDAALASVRDALDSSAPESFLRGPRMQAVFAVR